MSNVGSKQALLQRLGMTHPIIQAPMAGSSTAAMAAAASNAGALGTIALGASNAAQARELLAQTRARTTHGFAVNFFCHRPAVRDDARDQAWIAHLRPLLDAFGGEIALPLREIYKSFVDDREMQQLMLEQAPAAISFHFGLPAPALIAALKNKGVFLMATATSLVEAQQIEAAGIDAIVAQGVESGGHRGTFDDHVDPEIGTFALVRLLAQHSRLPIIAAGGIMDGQGIAAALSLGAQAVQMGTAFLLTNESNANEGYRALLKSPRAAHTRLTAAISGRRARGIVNRFITEVDTPSAPPPPDYPNTYDAGKQLHALAVAKGSQEFGAHWAGQAAALVRDGYSVAELVQLLADELRAARGSQ